MGFVEQVILMFSLYREIHDHARMLAACALLFLCVGTLFIAQGTVFSQEGFAKHALSGAFTAAACASATCLPNVIIAFAFALPVAFGVFRWIHKRADHEMELDAKVQAYRRALPMNKD